MPEIKIIHDKETWEGFLIQQRQKTFLHSWNWGEFNKKLGHSIFRLGIYENSNVLEGVFLVIKIAARRGSFLFVPQGPILDSLDSETLKHIATYLKELAIKEKCSFVRVSPIVLATDENRHLFQEAGFRRAPMHMHAELMWLLDLSISEEKLLRDMRKTTRYSIHKAEREGVTIVKSQNPDDVLTFKKIYDATATRQHFTPFSNEYLQKEFDTFKPDDQVLLFLASYKEKIITGAMVLFHGDSAFYHHGASTLEYPDIPAAYLVQWEAIKEAKRRGCRLYNFWGVAPDGKTKHPWSGLTLFKKGFGGYAEEYLASEDLIVTNGYWFNFLIEKLRKLTRNL